MPHLLLGSEGVAIIIKKLACPLFSPLFFAFQFGLIRCEFIKRPIWRAWSFMHWSRQGVGGFCLPPYEYHHNQYQSNLREWVIPLFWFPCFLWGLLYWLIGVLRGCLHAGSQTGKVPFKYIASCMGPCTLECKHRSAENSSKKQTKKKERWWARPALG